MQSSESAKPLWGFQPSVKSMSSSNVLICLGQCASLSHLPALIPYTNKYRQIWHVPILTLEGEPRVSITEFFCFLKPVNKRRCWRTCCFAEIYSESLKLLVTIPLQLKQIKSFTMWDRMRTCIGDLWDFSIKRNFNKTFSMTGWANIMETTCCKNAIL